MYLLRESHMPVVAVTLDCIGDEHTLVRGVPMYLWCESHME